MNYCGTLIAVTDMEKAKQFYVNILEQKIAIDLGVHVSFQSSLSLQSNYAELVGVDIKPLSKENNFQLYFEVEDIQHWYARISVLDHIDFLHGIKEYPWGQQVMRFYDPDQHIIEIAESMESVAKRFLKQGFSLEETSEKTMYPIEIIKQFL